VTPPRSSAADATPRPAHYLVQFTDEHGSLRERRTPHKDKAIRFGRLRAPSTVVAVFFGAVDESTGRRSETQESVAVFP
jgi:hypothetical protein